MASQYVISAAHAALTASVAKTVVEIPTSATAPAQIWWLEFHSGATAAGILTVELCTFVTTGTGTTYTPLKWGADQGVAANLGTVKITMTAEAATQVVLYTWRIPLPGMYSILLPGGLWSYLAANSKYLIRYNSTLAVTGGINVGIEI